MNNPRISVVCPCYNSALFITKALDSIVGQTRQPFELLISDDGSTDQTKEVVESFIQSHSSFPIHLLLNLHRGPGAARNQAILKAQGNWIAFIDSDDIWLPNKLFMVEQIIMNQSQVNLICNSEKIIYMNQSSIILHYGDWYQPNKNMQEQLYKRNFLSTSAVICQKQLIVDTGFFDETLLSAQDYELWLRMGNRIKPHFIREVLGVYYQRIGNISTTHARRRLRNILMISARYRSVVGTRLFIQKIIRELFSAGRQGIKLMFAHLSRGQFAL